METVNQNARAFQLALGIVMIFCGVVMLMSLTLHNLNGLLGKEATLSCYEKLAQFNIVADIANRTNQLPGAPVGYTDVSATKKIDAGTQFSVNPNLCK